MGDAATETAQLRQGGAMSSLRTFHSFTGTSAVVLALAIGLSAAMDPAAAKSSTPEKGAASATAPSASPEASERRTPRDTMAGFLEATGRRDYARAAEYLDLSRIVRAHRAEQGPALARDLRIVIDQAVPIDLDDLSDQAAGSPQEGLPPDRALVGTVSTKAGATQLLLQRMPGPEDGRTWKVAAATVAQIPRLYRELVTDRSGTTCRRPSSRSGSSSSPCGSGSHSSSSSRWPPRSDGSAPSSRSASSARSSAGPRRSWASSS
jgi:hypothetical protein